MTHRGPFQPQPFCDSVKTCGGGVVLAVPSSLLPTLRTSVGRSDHPSWQESGHLRGCCSAGPTSSHVRFYFLFHFPLSLAFFSWVLTVPRVHRVTPAAGACFIPLSVWSPIIPPPWSPSPARSLVSLPHWFPPAPTSQFSPVGK